ncbi:MAG: hypothetical protein DMG70_00225 [Acidobacteria bacterium]|nr:MAG: hypothetical protein DMG70_00225 [Acidobacteriota bacterium]
MASAKRKRNLKTHPRIRGEGDPNDDFMPPDRPDRIAESEAPDDQHSEVIDFSKTEVIDTGDVDQRGEIPPSQVERRGEADEPAPARREEREDRASRRRAEPEGDEDQDDRRGYSARVRKRIARERAVVNRERALREQTQKELTDERTARAELAERILKIERSTTRVAADADVKALEAQIDALKPQITAAVEAGETARALELQIKLGDLQADLKVKKYDLTLRAQNAAVVEESERKQRAAAEAAAKRGAAPAGDVPPEHKLRGNEFIRANRHWWRRDKEAQQTAQELDAEILADIADGAVEFEAYSDEHFEELAERLHEVYPDIEICDLDKEPYDFGDQDQTQGDRARDARGARVANGNQRGNGARPGNSRTPQGRLGTERQRASELEMARQGKVVLTAEDFKEMRIFKLDPNNPEHKKRFAQERARTLLASAGEAQDRGAR